MPDPDEETLIPDARAGLSPRDFVTAKVARLLMQMIRPRRAVESVAAELVAGLSNGSIALDDRRHPHGGTQPMVEAPTNGDSLFHAAAEAENGCSVSAGARVGMEAAHVATVRVNAQKPMLDSLLDHVGVLTRQLSECNTQRLASAELAHGYAAENRRLLGELAERDAELGRLRGAVEASRGKLIDSQGD